MNKEVMRYLLLLSFLLLVSCGSSEPEDPWLTIELGTDADFRDIFFLDAKNGWMVGGVGVSVPGGIVARTRDGGLTWRYQTRVIPRRFRTMSIDINAVWFLDELRGVLAAESGTIMRTDDGGGSWERVPPTGPVYSHYRDIDFIDERNGWMIGRRGVIRSEDGGESWKRIDEDLDMAGEALDMLNLWRGWMVGNFGQVLTTKDGGITWDAVPALGNLDGLTGDEKPHLRSVHFVDADHGWAAGSWREFKGFDQHDWAVIIHTKDSGRTWQRQIEGVESLLTAIRFADRDHGWAVGFNRNDGTSLILATTDGGEHWQTAKTIYGEELWALEVRDGYVWTAGDRVRKVKQRLFRLSLSGAEGVDQSH